MSIKKADSAGFCFGVNRAINIVNELLEKGIKVATLGPIIHNMEMVHELEERGCTPVKAVDELTDDTTLVIRSHGVEKSVIDSLVKRGINFEDATCPFVKKIHKIVSNTNPENDVVLIAGNKNYIVESPRKVLTVLCTPLGWILTTVIKKKCKLI